MDEASDILGGALPITRGSQSGQWSSLSGSIKPTFILALLLAAYIFLTYIWAYVLRWRERSYKLSMRRRHGIPDNDHRPFNVAYAAVRRARQENEAAERPGRKAEQQGSIGEQRNAVTEMQTIRQRSNNQRTTDSSSLNLAGTPGHWPGAQHQRFAADGVPGSIPAATDRLTPLFDFEERYTPNPTIFSAEAPDAEPAVSKTNSTSRRPGPKNLMLNASAVSNDDTRKRTLEHDDDAEEPDNTKKTRVEGRRVSKDTGHAASPENLDYSDPKRVAKRISRDEDEELLTSTRDKRARKVSLEHPHIIMDHEMDDAGYDLEAEAGPLEDIKKASKRGKKRDRAEAGSTFGGDDEDSPEDDGTGASRTRRRRKRRTVAKKKLDVAARGLKRDRETEGDSDIEGEDKPSRKLSSRKKRGKKGGEESLEEEDITHGESDISMDDAQISKDPYCKGRRIGEQWESNGVQYKVGPTGERLRQALVKKARSKFTMPQDSQHPDRQANLEVYVETWLTEDEYIDARDRQALAWQDSPKVSVEPETPGNVPDSPITKAGKNLLWESPVSENSPLPSLKPLSRLNPNVTVNAITNPQAYRMSVATSLGLRPRMNPFQESQSAVNRRVASPSSRTIALSESVSGSPARPSSRRIFSKWEKQDLEAEAMRKMKLRMEEAKKKEEEAKKPVIAALPAANTAVASSATATAATPTSAPSISTAPSFSFAKPADKSDGKNPTQVETGKGTAPVTPSFSLPGASTVPKITVTPPTSSSLGSSDDKPKAVSNPFAAPSGPSGTASSSTPSFSFQKSTTPALGNVTHKTDAASAKPSSAFPALNASKPNDNTGSALKFSFPPPTSQANKAASGGDQKNTSSGAQEGQSLFARLGGFASSSSTSPAPQSQPQANSTFSFQNPADSQKQASVFRPPSTGQQSAPTKPPGDSASTAAPGPVKFSFGFKPVSSNATSTTAAQSSQGPTQTSKSSPSPFEPSKAFNPETKATEAASTSVPAAKFNFSAPTSSSAFSSNVFGSKAPADEKSQTSAKSAFAGFAGSNAFLTPPAASGSVFGSASTFGSKAPASTEMKQDDATKTSFGGFGATSTFGGEKSAATASTEAKPDNGAPKTTFGNFGTSSTFSSKTPTATTSTETKNNDGATKGAFSGFVASNPFSTGATASTTPNSDSGPSKNAFSTFENANPFSTTPSATPASGSLFGTTVAPSTSQNTTSVNTAKSAFAGFGGSGLAFAAPASSTPSAFGGGGGDILGNKSSTAKATEGGQTSSLFTNNATTPTTPVATSGSTGFAFNFAPSTPTPTTNASTLASPFGTASTQTVFGAKPAEAGATTTTPNPSAFGFGAPTSSTPTFGGFGNQSQQQQ